MTEIYLTISLSGFIFSTLSRKGHDFSGEKKVIE